MVGDKVYFTAVSVNNPIDNLDFPHSCKQNLDLDHVGHLVRTLIREYFGHVLVTAVKLDEKQFANSPNPNLVMFCGVRHFEWKLTVDLCDFQTERRCEGVNFGKAEVGEEGRGVIKFSLWLLQRVASRAAECTH